MCPATFKQGQQEARQRWRVGSLIHNVYIFPFQRRALALMRGGVDERCGRTGGEEEMK